MLEAARKTALSKQARIMAEQELGIGDSDLPIQKGPLSPAPSMETVVIDLPPNSDRITLDGVVYMQGEARTLDSRVVAVIKEVMARGWEQEAVREGKESQFYAKAKIRNTAVNINSGRRVAA